MYRQRWIVIVLCCVALVTTLCSGTAKAAYIQGSGTTGRISKFTGASTIGDSVLFETAGNVGIGTTTPGTAKLFVAGAAPGAAPNIMTNGDIVIGAGGAIFLTGVHSYATDYIVSNAGYGSMAFFTSGVERMKFIANGNVGIGTTSPSTKLHINSGTANAVALFESTDPTALISLKDDTTTGYGYALVRTGDTLELRTMDTARVVVAADGKVGIGTMSPTEKLQVDGTVHSTTGGFKFPDGTVQTTAATGGGGGGGGWVDAGTDVILATTTDMVGIGTTTPSRALTVRGNILVESEANGVPVMEFGEGLDYAEGFDVTDEAAPAPGSVLVIDTDNPGRLTMSTKPYDSRVAGIVAGAKGLGSAVRLGVGQFDCDVALAGRVYCNVDATESAVQPGDLLTTSTMAGWAMKAVDPGLTHGATLGKAMQGLEKGQKGQILVLVTLQ